MTTETTTLAYFSAASLVAIFFGLLRRDRARLCWSFLVYILLVTGGILLPLWWPDRFWNSKFYLMTQTVHFATKGLIALEIAQRTFASFPRAGVRAGLGMIGVLGALAGIGVALPDSIATVSALLGIVVPRQQVGMLMIFAVIACVSQWYRVPVHPLHRAVMTGFGVLLTVNATTLGLAGWYDWSPEVYRILGTVDMAASSLTNVWWAWAAWRPVASPGPVLARLQPWAHSW